MWWTVTFIAKLGATPNPCQHPASSQVSRFSGKDHLGNRNANLGGKTPNSDGFHPVFLSLHRHIRFVQCCSTLRRWTVGSSLRFSRRPFEICWVLLLNPKCENENYSTLFNFLVLSCFSSFDAVCLMMYLLLVIYHLVPFSWFYLGIQGIHCLFHFLGSQVLTDGYWREYPWTVKVDPDAATWQMLEVEIAEGFNKGIKRKISV